MHVLKARRNFCGCVDNLQSVGLDPADRESSSQDQVAVSLVPVTNAK